jgi:hypothetical protein
LDHETESCLKEIPSPMITLLLEMTPQADVSLHGLWAQALPAVINTLSQSGYSVDQEPTSETVDHIGSLRQYRLEPGAGRLWAATNNTDGGSIRFTLDGVKFGIPGDVLDRDPVVWMGLVVLGVQLQQMHSVLASVSDSDLPRPLFKAAGAVNGDG